MGTSRLSGKTALITGAGSGIGQAIAQRFAEEGARIAVADINSDAAQETVETLSTESVMIQMDVTSKASVVDGVENVISQFAHLDILVNNAGCLSFSSFEDCSEDLWNRMVDTNLKGTFLCTQAVLKHMKHNGSGVVINMSSLAAKTGGLASGPPYAASKAGVSALTLGLARELAPHGIRSVGIAPGIIDTPMTSSPVHDRIKSEIPLGEVGRAIDVANCALFLASDEARHITGEIVDVNGGLFMD